MDIYLQVLKTSLAAALSWMVVTSVLNWPYPYFAPLAAILTVQATISESVKKAWQRLLGTIGGVVISALISQWMSVGALSIFIVIVAGMAIGSLLHLPAYINSQAAVSSLMVLAFSQSQGYALNRVTETIIGSVIGILANTFIFPPNSVAKAEQDILILSKKASFALKKLGWALQKKNINVHSPLVDVEDLEKNTVKSIHSIQLAHESLVFNPLMTKKCRRLTEITEGMRHLANISIQIRGIRRGLLALAEDFPESLELNKLKVAIDAAADCVEDFGINLIDPSKDISLRLKTRISQAMTAQSDCLSALLQFNSLILSREIGAILTDLHRILEEVSSDKWENR